MDGFSGAFKKASLVGESEEEKALSLNDVVLLVDNEEDCKARRAAARERMVNVATCRAERISD